MYSRCTKTRNATVLCIILWYNICRFSWGIVFTLPKNYRMKNYNFYYANRPWHIYCIWCAIHGAKPPPIMFVRVSIIISRVTESSNVRNYYFYIFIYFPKLCTLTRARRAVLRYDRILRVICGRVLCSWFLRMARGTSGGDWCTKKRVMWIIFWY